MNLFKFLVALEKGKKDYLDIPAEEQKRYLDSLGEPRDDYDRSYFQCKCYYMTFPWYSKSLYWVVSFISLPFFVLYAWIKGFGVRPKYHVDAVCEEKHMPEIIPTSLRDEYDISYKEWQTGFSLHTSDLPFVFSIIRHKPFAALCNFKTIVKVAKYSTIIKRYSPRAIIVHAEYSYTSSLLTLFCERNEVRHIDVMHGEKIYQIRDTFFRFDKCYVWDDYYKELLISLKAEPTQFVVAVPPSLSIDIAAHHSLKDFADYKYYLAIFDEKKLAKIIQCVEVLKRSGKSVKFRPHPRYSDQVLLVKYVSPDEIEKPEDVNILTSISSTSCAISEFSTVLTQAYFSGKNIMLDDVSDSMIYDKLAEHQYIFATQKVDRLSTLISK